MTHYDRKDWSDFARGLVRERERRAMSRHLDTGCQRCARSLGVQRTVVALADADRRQRVPDQRSVSSKASSR